MKMDAKSRALDKIYKRRNRYDIPDWQRDEVWTATMKQRLIDTILRGWQLPKLYFYLTSRDPEEYEVVDGQQRLNAIFEFYDNELPLSDESAKIFRGKLYRELPESVSDSFDDYEIQYDEITDADEGELREFFLRLQGGLPLTSSEKLNAVTGGLTDYCRSLARHAFLTESTTVSQRRYALFDIVAKIAAIEVGGLDTGLRYDDLERMFKEQSGFSAESSVARRMMATLDYLRDAFPDKEPRLKNRTIVQSLITLTIRLNRDSAHQVAKSTLREFYNWFIDELASQVQLGQDATDMDFVEFQKTVNANLRSGAATRQRILLRRLLIHDPKLITTVDQAAVLEAQLPDDLGRVSASIRNLVHAANVAYSAVNGVDLIKPTNKTIHALDRISSPVSCLDEYKEFIDNLYFLLHEGVGDRLSEKPGAFKDINSLRTDIRHDLDHGQASRSSAKRRQVGQAFTKYAGTGTPETAGPLQFVVLQSSLLRAVESDLITLSTTNWQTV